MTVAVRAADICLYCINWGFRLPSWKGLSLNTRDEIARDGIGPVDRSGCGGRKPTTGLGPTIARRRATDQSNPERAGDADRGCTASPKMGKGADRSAARRGTTRMHCCSRESIQSAALQLDRVGTLGMRGRDPRKRRRPPRNRKLGAKPRD